MALVLPDGFGLAQVTINIAGGAGPAVNVWGLDNNTSTAQENAEALRDGYENAIMPALTFSAVLDRVKVVQRDGAVYSVGEATSVEAGGLAVASAPPAVTYLVKKITASAGRSGRGRVYLPGVAEGEVDSGGGLSTTQFNLLQTALNGLIAGYTPGLLVLLHRDPAVPSNYNFAPPTPITNLFIESRVATQRRRNR